MNGREQMSARRRILLAFRQKRLHLTGRGDYACRKCAGTFTQEQWQENAYVCPACGYHAYISGKRRMALLLDTGSFLETEKNLQTADPLHFPDYGEKLEENRKKSGMQDALLTGTGTISGIRTALAVLDASFMMGSMGTVVGEKLTRLIELADRESLPLVVFTASGGARMQEGIFSLFQMAKTAGAVRKFQEHGGFYLVVQTHPTTGGVSASFASLGDVILAEPGALIGFAGPRVIAQTIHEKLPEGFQRAEFQKEHGFADRITDRRNMRQEISQLLRLHGYQKDGR